MSKKPIRPSFSRRPPCSEKSRWPYWATTARESSPQLLARCFRGASARISRMAYRNDARLQIVDLNEISGAPEGIRTPGLCLRRATVNLTIEYGRRSVRAVSAADGRTLAPNLGKVAFTAEASDPLYDGRWRCKPLRIGRCRRSHLRETSHWKTPVEKPF